MKIRFAADCADATDSRGLYLFLSALIRLICVICGESKISRQDVKIAKLFFASFFLCGGAFA